MAQPIKRIKTARGVRYMRGGKFISKAAVKRSRAAKKRTKKAAPKRKRTTTIKRPRVTVTVKTNVKRKTVKRKANPRKDPKRVAAGKKAARTRAKKAAARSLAGKKAARTRKKKTTKKTRSKSVITKAQRRKWGRKGGLKAARMRKAKGRKKTTKRKTTRRKTAKRKTTRRKKTVRTLMLRPARKRRGKKVKHRVIRRKRRYTVKKNPMKTMKSALMSGLGVFAGLMGMKVINNALRIHVTEKVPGIPAQLVPILPSLAGFLASTIVVPKVTKKKKFVDALQMGATVAMLDAVFAQFVRPQIAKSPALAPYFAGDMTVYEPVAAYQVHEPVAEYVDYDNRLGDYVPDNRYGQFQVTEALAADEIDYMQRGGAGGVFAKTTLGRG